MPGMDAFAFRAAQAADQRIASVPVVILSVSGDLEIRARDTSSGRNRLRTRDDPDEIAVHSRGRVTETLVAFRAALFPASSLPVLPLAPRLFFLPLECRGIPGHAQKVRCAQPCVPASEGLLHYGHHTPLGGRRSARRLPRGRMSTLVSCWARPGRHG